MGKKKKILIDDDILIQLGWQLKAEKENYEIDCYFNVYEFVASSSKYPLNTEIYIDSNLGQEAPGEIQAKKIFELGFQNIYLNTAYEDIQINDFPWIKKIIKKN